MGTHCKSHLNHSFFVLCSGIFGNPLGSPTWWKPVTFGGEVGMNIIKDCSLQKLVCDNVAGCPKVSFKVPDGITYSGQSDVTPDDNTSDILMTMVRDKLRQDKAKQSCEKSDSQCEKNNPNGRT